jgi:hypothetical protein
MKKILEHYWESTPKTMRKIGDSLLVVAIAVIADKASGLNLTSFLTEKETRYIAIGGIVGKFLTNFFKKEDEAKPGN